MDKGSLPAANNPADGETAQESPSDAATAAEAFERAFSARVPEQIGGYRILRLIGQGGMGAVYEAEQQHPRRKVALKVIRAGLLSRAMLRRFGFEVEMLGRLQHPGIARIYEAGTAQTDAGLQPYFAMEFVAGRPLLKHAAEMNLRAKLELLARIADAVHHAHQNGIIHRDLKPDNILVDEHGQPKVLDFGVARSTQSDAAATLQTETGAIVGTLSYMSPEQAAGEVHQIDVRSDVYALGVIAYQLLLGKLPYALPRDSLVTALRLIRELDPEPVGSRVRELRGDVETILAKALEKEKERRYQSAHDLAADIRRHLNDEPITARPADTMYHLSKFVRRNRALVGGVAATFLVLILGLLATMWYWRDAVVNRKLAEQHEREANIRLITSRIAEGDALALVGRVTVAKQRHEQALALARDLGESPLPAQYGLWEDRRHSPEALAVWRSQPVTALAFSADGKRAVTGGSFVVLWDVARGTVLREFLPADERGGASVALSADGRRLAVGTGMGSLMMWDTESGELLWSTRLHGAPVCAVAFIPDEDQVLSVSLDRSVGLVDASNGAPRRRLGATPGQTPGSWSDEGSAAISPDARLAAVGDNKGFVTVYEVKSGAVLHEFRAHEGAKVHGMCFMPDSQALVTASSDKTVVMWDMADARHIRSFIGHENGVASVSASIDGTRLLTGSWDQTVRLWDVQTGRVLRTFTGHTGNMVAAKAVAFSPDMTLAISGANDVRLWSLRPERQVRILTPPEFGPDEELPRVVSVHLSPDARLIVSASNDGAVRLWDVQTGLLLRKIAAHDGPAVAALFAPDGRHVLSAGAGDGLLKLWDIFSERNDPVLQLDAQERQTSAVALSPDGKYAISGGKAAKVHVWDLASGELVRVHEGPDEVCSLAWGPDAERALAVFGTSTVTVEVIDPVGAGHSALISQQPNVFHDVDVARFQPGQGRLISAGGWSGMPRLWSGEPPYRPQGDFTGNPHGSAIIDLIFTADSKFLITAGWDNTMRIWDIERRQLIRAFVDHERPVASVDVSGNGLLAASGSHDGTVRLWDLWAVTGFEEQRDAALSASRTLQNQRGDGDAMLSLARWYSSRGAEPLALRLLEEAAAAGAQISSLQRARCHVALEQWDEARQDYERAGLASEAPAEYVRACLNALPSHSRNRAATPQAGR